MHTTAPCIQLHNEVTTHLQRLFHRRSRLESANRRHHHHQRRLPAAATAATAARVGVAVGVTVGVAVVLLSISCF